MSQTKAQLLEGKAANIEFSAGTAALPAITFTGDINTGIYSPAADTIAFAEGGVESMRIDSSGRLGIGTTSPAAALDIGGAGSSAASFVSNPKLGITGDIFFEPGSGNNVQIVNFRNTSMVFGTNGSEKVRVTNDGKFLVGTSTSTGVVGAGSYTPSVQIARVANANLGLYGYYADAAGDGATLIFTRSKSNTIGTNTIVQSGDELGAIWFAGANGTGYDRAALIKGEVDGTPGSSNDMPGRLVFSTTADGASSPTERMRIGSNGQTTVTSSNNLGTPGGAIIANNQNVSSSGVGTFSSSLGSAGSANNTSCWHLQAITQGAAFYFLYGNGTSSFTSDARKKKNIETTRDGYLEDLSKLRVVKYNWFNQDDSEPKELGLIAQEVEQVFPGLVQEADKLEGDDFNCKVLKGSVLPFMLLKALQEATARIETLEAEVAALKSA